MTTARRRATVNRTPTLDTMKLFTFGVELETITLNREKCAKAVLAATGGTLRYLGGGYNKWAVKMADGREWISMSDASLSGGRRGKCAEVVTPIMTYADLDLLQKVARALHDAGARTDASCGIHVHIGANELRADALTRLAKLVYQQEPLLFAALGVVESRSSRWCKPVEERLIASLAQRRPTTHAALENAWYGAHGDYGRSEHYHQSRYHGLNMHSVFYRGTVEFRYFEGTLHAGKIKSYVQLCLAMAAKAKVAKNTVARKREHVEGTSKYDFRVFLLRLGLIGDEFKTARLHLLAGTKGCASFKHGRPAKAPKAGESAPEMAAPPAAEGAA